MSVWEKKKFVEVVAETKDKEVTTRIPIPTVVKPVAEPKEAPTAPKDEKEKTVNEEKNTNSYNTGNYKRKTYDKNRANPSVKGGKRETTTVSGQEQENKNVRNVKEKTVPVPERKEMIIGTVKGAGAWGNDLLVDKIKVKTAEEEAAAAAAAANRKSRMREKPEIVKESPVRSPPVDENNEEPQEVINSDDTTHIQPSLTHVAEVSDEDKHKMEEVQVTTPVLESNTPNAKEEITELSEATQKDEGMRIPAELVPSFVEETDTIPTPQDPLPSAEQPAVVLPPVVTFPEGVSIGTNIQCRFEGFLYTPKQDVPAEDIHHPRSPNVTQLSNMSAVPPPMTISQSTRHAPISSSREYTGFQQPISNMKANVALPPQHQRFSNYGPPAPNWNGNIINHMGIRYTSEYGHHGQQQGSGFGGAPQSHQQHHQYNRNYNMQLAHGQPMRSSHHHHHHHQHHHQQQQQQGTYQNATQAPYANNGYNRQIRRNNNNNNMINMPRPNNSGGQLRPQGQQQGYPNPFYAPRNQYHSLNYRGTGATYYQPHHHNQYNPLNNTSGNYINQHPNIINNMGRGGGGSLPAYTQQQ